MREEKNCKIVILGGSSTGKTTLFRHFKSLFKDHDSCWEDRQCGTLALSNALLLLRLALFLTKEEIVESEKNQDIASQLILMTRSDIIDLEPCFISSHFIEQLAILWKSERKLREFVREEQYMDFSIAERVHESLYVLDRLSHVYKEIQCGRVSREIVLRSAQTTMKLQSAYGYWKGMNITIVDTPDVQHDLDTNYRMLSGASCAILCVSLVDYYKYCYDDRTMNRTVESMGILSDICVSSHYNPSDCHLVLIFTHFDQFKSSLRYKSLTEVFPEYNPSQSHVSLSLSLLERELSDHEEEGSSGLKDNSTKDLPEIDISPVPDDVQCYIFTFLHPIELGILSLANSHYYRLVNSDEVWSCLCHKFEPNLKRSEVLQVYKDCFYSYRRDHLFKHYFVVGGYQSYLALQYMIQEFLNLIPKKDMRIDVINVLNINEPISFQPNNKENKKKLKCPLRTDDGMNEAVKRRQRTTNDTEFDETIEICFELDLDTWPTIIEFCKNTKTINRQLIALSRLNRHSSNHRQRFSLL